MNKNKLKEMRPIEAYEKFLENCEILNKLNPGPRVPGSACPIQEAASLVDQENLQLIKVMYEDK